MEYDKDEVSIEYEELKVRERERGNDLRIQTINRYHMVSLRDYIVHYVRGITH